MVLLGHHKAMTLFVHNEKMNRRSAIAATAALVLTVAGLLPRAFAFDALFQTSRCNLTPLGRERVMYIRPSMYLRQSSSDDDELDAITSIKSRGASNGAVPKPFSVSPITLSVKKQPEPPKETVNSATLGFNKKLNEMSKNVDSKTAAKVESLLFDALAKYEEYLSTPEGKANPYPRDMIIPNTVSFTNVITTYARSNTKESPYKAQELLDKMHTLYAAGMKHVKPNKISYNSVINAWAKSKEYRSARKTEKLLWRLFDFYREEGGNDEALRPDARTFNSVINAVARSREKNCADRAKYLLDEMGRLYNEGDTELVPHAVSFGAIINAYANSGDKGASDKAAQLLMHMESLYQLGFENAKPTTFVYNACLNSFAKDQGFSSSNIDAAKTAEQLLISMEKRYEDEKDGRIKPDCISYSTVINAFANSANVQSGINSDRILRQLINRYLLGDYQCRPNAVAFTATIKAHSAAINATMALESTNGDDKHSKEFIESSARRCEDLLQQTLLLHRDHGNDKSLKPTDVTFELTMAVLRQAGDLDGVKRVQMLREESNTSINEKSPRFRSFKSNAKR